MRELEENAVLCRSSLYRSERSTADDIGTAGRFLHDPSGLLSGGTLYTDPPEGVSPRGGIRGNGVADRQDQKYLGSNALGLAPAPLSISPRMKAKPSGSNADIAPWLSDGPEPNTQGFNQNMFGDASSKPPSIRPGTGRSGNTESSDPLSRGDDRHPSMNSTTTAGSGSSWSKANRRDTGANKYAPFIGDDGQKSSKSSEVSLPITLQRETTNSSQHSSQSNRQDSGGMHSPTSSRPRTPFEIPSSDVTPWLFQDFKVRKADLFMAAIFHNLVNIPHCMSSFDHLKCVRTCVYRAHMQALKLLSW